jgi:hypothetical protein
MAQRESEPQKCKGRFGSLTHTGVKERVSVIGLKDGVHGFIHNPKFPQNQGPSLKSNPCLLQDQTQQ